MEAMSGVILIVYILFWSFANAAASWFLDFCFEDGNIFDGYINFLVRTFGVESFWFKPLGGCVVCMNIWLSVPIYLLCIWLFKIDFSLLAHFGLWLIYAVISNTILRKLLRH